MEERLAPGTKTMHIKNGWNFSRQPDGDVRIHIVVPNGPANSDNAPLAEITIPASEWISIIAAMSAYQDENPSTAFSMASDFHRDIHTRFGRLNA